MVLSGSAKVGTKFRQKVTVGQSVSFACALKVTEFFVVVVLSGTAVL
jgi:hypothetical protein